MNDDKPLSLQVTPKQLNAFCKKIINRSRNTANIHEALVVLEAFMSSFSSDSHGTDSYQNIQERLKEHSEITRNKLMVEKTQQLLEGLKAQNIFLLSSVYCSLSRNGFYQILKDASDLINDTEATFITEWVVSWASDAKQRAEEASGYPDALDFQKANINIEHYQTMTDIAHFLKNNDI